MISDRLLPAPFSVDQAVAIARQAHEGQLDKAGQPYINHPLRVMAAVEDEHAKMAAVLHDLIEDTAMTAEGLVARGCPPQVVSAVTALSKVPGETQRDYLRRLVADPIARVVKRADLADNSDPKRLALLDPAVRARLIAKYDNARQLLDQYEREAAG